MCILLQDPQTEGLVHLYETPHLTLLENLCQSAPRSHVSKIVYDSFGKDFCPQVLVVFLGEQFSHWQSPSQLLPYRQHEAEKILAASELKHAGQMPRYNFFQKGVEVALGIMPTPHKAFIILMELSNLPHQV